jgi:protein TonB
MLSWAGVTRSTEVVRLAPLETAFDPPPPAVELPTRSQAIVRPGRPIPLASPAAGPPELIPYDIAPLLENSEAVTALIRNRFPRDLELTETEPAVLLWLFVDQSGRVTRLQLARSSGHARLDNLAELAAREMAFRPAIHAGKAVAVWVAQRIRFTHEIEVEADGPTSAEGERSDDRQADRIRRP